MLSTCASGLHDSQRRRQVAGGLAISTGVQHMGPVDAKRTFSYARALFLRSARVTILSGPSKPKFICEALVVSVSAGDVGRVLVVEVADIGPGPLPPSLEKLMERRERGPGMFEAYRQRCVLDVRGRRLYEAAGGGRRQVRQCRRF